MRRTSPRRVGYVVSKRELMVSMIMARRVAHPAPAASIWPGQYILGRKKE
jgi:hypothetical protein